MTAGGAEKSQQCHKYFLQCSTFTSKRPQVRTRGGKLYSCSGQLLTSLRPCLGVTVCLHLRAVSSSCLKEFTVSFKVQEAVVKPDRERNGWRCQLLDAKKLLSAVVGVLCCSICRSHAEWIEYVPQLMQNRPKDNDHPPDVCVPVGMGVGRGGRGGQGQLLDFENSHFLLHF